MAEPTTPEARPLGPRTTAAAYGLVLLLAVLLALWGAFLVPLRIGTVPVPLVRSWMSMAWGVETFIGETVDHTDEMVRQVDEALLKIGRAEEGDIVVIIAGSPPGIPGSTNALRVHRMGDAINEVAPAYRRARTG